jgi:NAD(P)-dependent dehydrogenase (short-subunit alcohol dehydrogenase family)
MKMHIIRERMEPLTALDKKILITGGNAGIGAAMAKILSSQGYDVKIICRSREKAEKFISSVNNKNGGSISFIEGDFNSIKSSREAAIRIRKESPEFSVFIHNAGMWPEKLNINCDGFEESFMTNHMAPFILNTELEDLFKKNRCRVVQVSAALYIAGVKDVQAAASGKDFSLLKTYPTTKFFNLLSSMHFARRWEGSGVTINSVHPGVVKTGLGNMQGIGGILLKAVKFFFISPEEGAKAPIVLAIDPKLKGLTGKYFDRFKMVPLSPMALDEKFSQEVWDQASELYMQGKFN